MPKFQKTILLAISIVLLSSVPLKAKDIYFPALKSGTISITDDDGAATPLKSQQLNEVSKWLHGHEEGWGRMWTAAPKPRATITLTHSDGQKTIVYIYDAKWSTAVEVERRAKNDAHKFRQINHFPEDEIAELLAKAQGQD